MNHVRVLIIDDDKDLRKALYDTLTEDTEWTVSDHGFEGLKETLVRFRPDVLVLDLVEGEPPNGTGTGNRSFDQIRETWFCPVVVYSAFPDEQCFDHPLVETITKGVDADVKVRNRLEKFVPQAQMIRSVHEDFDARIREALRDSVYALREQIDAEADGSGDSILTRAVRRLVAARVDVRASAGAMLRAWERWVVPPLGNHLLTADLLRQKEEDWTNGDAFRLVLTPSCDLVSGRNLDSDRVRVPKVDKVLVARCEPMGTVGGVQLQKGQPLASGSRSKLRSILTEGMADNLVPIPRFRGHVPLMAANLRRLELIEWNRINIGMEDGDAEAANSEFDRVASTDSPFREMVVSAYLRVTGRPGVPDINIDCWLDDISNHFATNDEQA